LPFTSPSTSSNIPDIALNIPDIAPDIPNIAMDIPNTTPDITNITPDTAHDIAPDIAQNIALNIAPDIAINVAIDIPPDIAIDITPKITRDIAPDITPNIALDIAPNMEDTAYDITPDITKDIAHNPFASDFFKTHQLQYLFQRYRLNHFMPSQTFSKTSTTQYFIMESFPQILLPLWLRCQRAPSPLSIVNTPHYRSFLSISRLQRVCMGGCNMRSD